MEKLHIPVMLHEVLEALQVKEGGNYADLTFGEGGHTEALLRLGTHVFSIDRDLQAIKRYQESGEFRANPNLQLTHALASEFSTITKDLLFDGILLDLGVSTRQLLEQERGFSFSKPGPLDMRMDSTSGITLSDLLSDLDEDSLGDILEENTDLKKARGIARRILNAFESGELKTTADLAALFPKFPGQKTHPATVMFLGLRMAVNQELQQIKSAIPQAFERLKPGGRLVVLTFHSSEDRVVKKLFLDLCGKCFCSGQICGCPKIEKALKVYKKPLIPSQDESRKNPRARSVKLRCIEKKP
jgi:16S rRNA (cytosine1402-N4)-methyltransferase